jgi:glycosyltransferase involved in cell wall biosynthesis
MQRRRLLLVSYHFPPSNMVASLRSYSFAKYLAQAGYEVVVVAMDTSGSGMDQSLNLDCSGFEVVRVPPGRIGVKHIDYYRRAAAGAGPKALAREMLNRAVQTAARIKNLCLGNLLTPEDCWFARALRVARDLAAQRGFDVLLTSHGPISCHLVGLLLKREHADLFWVADYRDPWCNNANLAAPVWPFTLLQSLVEEKVNRKADHLTTVSHPLVEDYFEGYRGKVSVIENGYFPEEVASKAPASSPAAEKRAGCFICAHTGTFYPGSYRVAPLLQALSLLFRAGFFDDSSFELRSYGSNADDLRRALKSELEGVVKIFAPVSREQSLEIQRGATALLFFSSDDPRYRGVYSSKIFEYLASGRPIVVIGNGEGNCAAELVREAGAGFVCGSDVEKIAEAFRSIAAGKLPRRNEEVIAAFSRERLADKLVEVIEGAQATGSSHPG